MNNDDGTTLVLLCDLCKVDGDLGRSDTNCDTIEDTSSDQHARAVVGDLDSSSDDPEDAGEHERVPSANSIGDGTSDDGTNDRTSSEGRTNGALKNAGRIVVVVDILVCQDDGGHGGNVEAEQHASHCRDTREEVGVVNLLHGQ